MPIDTQAAVNAAWGESVSYAVAGGSTYTVTAGRHIDGETEGVTSYGVYTIRRESYTLATDAISNWTPKLRDTITPSGLAARVVTGIGPSSPWLKFWKVLTEYPALADSLDQTADVKRPTNSPTDEGFRSPSFTNAYSSVACRLQPDTRTREMDMLGGVKTVSRFVVIFGSAVVLNAGDVVEVSSVKYEVTEQSEVESLGVLTFAGVERIS